MPGNAARDRAEELLALADVAINGDRPWDIQVHDERFYARVMTGGELGLGESYMDGWWDCDKLDEFVHRALRAGLGVHLRLWKDSLLLLQARLVNLQNPARAYRVGRHHYDLGIDIFRSMLDKRLIYSCGYWKDAATLDDAQEAKLDLVCRKLELRSGMRVLDIGCGWGGTPRFVAERYGAAVLGVTVSKEQAKHGQQLCEGLDVEIRLQDYRSVEGMFDRVLSLGMFEHVGYKNYGTFMRFVRSHLADDGLFLLHSIAGNRSRNKGDPWTDRYIFPNSMLPSGKQICAAIEGVFVIEDWHNFGADYDKTLMHWYQNFERNWPVLKDRYDERFFRMWRYYLLSCAGSFRARKNQLWQIVLSPRGVPGGYRAPR